MFHLNLDPKPLQPPYFLSRANIETQRVKRKMKLAKVEVF